MRTCSFKTTPLSWTPVDRSGEISCNTAKIVPHLLPDAASANAGQSNGRCVRVCCVRPGCSEGTVSVPVKTMPANDGSDSCCNAEYHLPRVQTNAASAICPNMNSGKVRGAGIRPGREFAPAANAFSDGPHRSEHGRPTMAGVGRPCWWLRAQDVDCCDRSNDSSVPGADLRENRSKDQKGRSVCADCCSQG